jgi:hypothetical protein
VVATHTASAIVPRWLKLACVAFRELRWQGFADVVRVLPQGFADVVRVLPRRLMVDCRWSASRSFLLAAARLRGLHLDSSGAASGLAAMRKDAEVWSARAVERDDLHPA